MVHHELVDLECVERVMTSSNISTVLREHRLQQLCRENASSAAGPGSNVFTDPSQMTVSEKILFTMVISAVILFTTSGNLLTIVAVANGRYLKSLSHLFIASLATADLIVGSVVMPFSMLYTVTYDGHWIFGPVLCDIWQFADYVGCSASLTNLCTIALDRYLTVSRPLQTMHARTRRRVWTMILFTWLVPVVHWSVFIAVLRIHNGPPLPGTCSLVWQPQVTVIVSASIIIYIPILVILSLFTLIYWTLRVHVKTLTPKLRPRLRRRPSAEDASFSRDSESEMNSTADSIHLRHLSVQEGAEVGREELDVNTGCWGFLAQSLDRYRSTSDTEPRGFSSSGSVKESLLESRANQAKRGSKMTPVLNGEFRVMFKEARERIHSADEYPNDDVFDETPERSFTEETQFDRKGTSGNGSVMTGHQGHSTSDEDEGAEVAVRVKSKRTIPKTDTNNSGSATQVRAGFNKERIQLSSSSTNGSPDSIKHGPTRSRRFSFPSNEANMLDTSSRKKQTASLVKSRLTRQIRAARMLSIIMTFLLLCWLPFAVMWPLRSFCPECVTQRLYNFSFWVNYTNSAINPILYCLCNPAFRIAFRQLLSRKRH